MTATRIYQAIPLSAPTSITLDEKASHHLARVLRLTVGDPLTVFNGEGGEYAAVITQLTKKNVSVDIKQFSPRDVESPLQIHLAQGIARGEKMDFIVQKAVELGVTHLIPLVTERCNVRLDNEREENAYSSGKPSPSVRVNNLGVIVCRTSRPCKPCRIGCLR